MRKNQTNLGIGIDIVTTVLVNWDRTIRPWTNGPTNRPTGIGAIYTYNMHLEIINFFYDYISKRFQ